MSDMKTAGRRRKGTISVPVGLEQLLYTAAKDAELRAELIRDRNEAAARRGLELTASERSVLAIAPDDQLEAMIDRIDTSEHNLKKRGFMRAVAATAVTLAAGTGLGACGSPSDKPAVETDAPFQGQAQEIDIEVQPGASRGIRPDPVPFEKPDAGPAKVEIQNPEAQTSGGARPDIDEEPIEPQKPKIKIKKPDVRIGGITVERDDIDGDLDL
ncbi:MAG: hypothetical protein JRF63_01705 [Deltaproteobacteria bacterium]|nr:hypothetical protein [Deltaproteobacteria bacterium]